MKIGIKKVVLLYLIAMFLGFPLFFHDYYFDIMEAKYGYIRIVTLIFFLLFCYAASRYEKLFSWKNFKSWDLLYVVFFGFAVISVLLSEHKMDAVFGTAGRYLGLILYVIYGLILLMIVGYGRYLSKAFYVLGISTILTGVLAVLNHYNIDPLGFYKEIVSYQRMAYISTLGHVDFASIYFGVMFVFFAMLLIQEEQLGKMGFYAIAMIFAELGFICSGADTGYGAAIILFVFGCFFTKSKIELLKYLLCILSFWGTVRLIGTRDLVTDGTIKLEGYSYLITRSGILMPIIIIIALLCLALGIWILFQEDATSPILQKIGRNIKKIGLMVILGLLVSGVILMLSINLFGIQSVPDIFGEKLRITDTWGSNRGYIWRKSIEAFQNFSIGQKLFGTGPDTAVYVYESVMNDEFMQSWNMTVNNAHCETIQLLLTHGVLGCVTYYLWIILSMLQCLKNRRYAIFMALLAFEGMMMICVNMISVTAIPFILLCMGKCEEKEEVA